MLKKIFLFRYFVKQDEIKSSLNNLVISDKEFYRIKNLPREKLSLREFASVCHSCLNNYK